VQLTAVLTPRAYAAVDAQCDHYHRPSTTRAFPDSAQELADWLWEHLGATETRFRRACMRCLTTLAPLLPLPGTSSRNSKSKNSSNSSNSTAAAASDPCYCLQQWVQARAAAAASNSSSSDAVKSAAVADMVRVFEKSYCPVPVAALSLTAAAASTNSSSSISNSSSAAGRTAAVQSWLDHLSTATDCYLFALDTGILTAVDIALPASSASSGSSSGKAKRPAAASTSGDTNTATASTSPHILNSFAAFVRHYSSTLHNSSSSSDGSDNSSSTADDDDGAASLWAQLTTAGASVDAALSQEEPLLPQQADAIKLLRAQVLRRGFALLDKLLAQLTASEQAAALCSSSSSSSSGSSARNTAVWSSPLHELLLLSLTCPWHKGLLPRPSEADEVQSLLPAAAERLLRHWRSLDDAASASGSTSALLLHSTQRLLHVIAYSDAGLTEHYDLCDYVVRRYALASTATVSAEAAEQMTLQTRAVSRDTEVCAHVLRSYSALHRAGLLAAGASQLQPAALAKALMRTLAALPLAQLKPEAHTVLCGALRFAVALGLPMVARTPADEPSMLR
jgi:hypothetical protein